MTTRPPVVLIADDDEELATILDARLTALGCVVLTAADGDSALRLFAEKRPALVLIDIHMPRLDGLAAMRDMLCIDPKARVIVMSGDASSDRARFMLEEGAADYLVKPLDMRALETSVEVNLIEARS